MNQAAVQHPLNITRTHQGVARIENGLSAARELSQRFTLNKSVAAALLGAVLASLVLVADHYIDTWGDEHLMAAWVLLWALSFFALGLLSGSASRLAKRLVQAGKNWAAQSAQARADDELWAHAKHDPRVMADIRAAQARAKSEAQNALPGAAAAPAPVYSADSARGANISDEIEASYRRRSAWLQARAYL